LPIRLVSIDSAYCAKHRAASAAAMIAAIQWTCVSRPPRAHTGARSAFFRAPSRRTPTPQGVANWRAKRVTPARTMSAIDEEYGDYEQDRLAGYQVQVRAVVRVLRQFFQAAPRKPDAPSGAGKHKQTSEHGTSSREYRCRRDARGKQHARIIGGRTR